MQKTYLGLDFHKSYSMAKIIDEKGRVVKSGKLQNLREDFKEFLEPFPNTTAVVEACWNYQVAVRLLEDHTKKVILANPLKVKAIAEAKIKTDSIDAETLAQLLRADLIPEAYLRDNENRNLQKILRNHCFYTRRQTQLKNKIHVLIDGQEEDIREKAKIFSDLFGKKGMEWLKSLELPEPDNNIIRDYLEIYELLGEKKKINKEYIVKLSSSDEDCKLLKSIPGIGDFLALLIKTEIGDIRRFRNSSKLLSYAGIIPSTYKSAKHTYHGRITKRGNKWLRWGMVEAVRGGIINNINIRYYYERIKSRKGVNKARIATAKRMLQIVYRVLNEKDEFKSNLKSSNRK